ncbi:MAG: ABC transporter permease [Acidobacteriia bacterium]|nr:ABC transporter permease [Terriglobia bacterium]
MAVHIEWINRLRHLVRGSRFEGDLDGEIRFHLETRSAELESLGLSRSAAQAQARREFGSIALMQEDSRAPWQFRWLQDLAADLRYAFRTFRRSPAFTLTAVVSLALGIGATSAIFTTLDAVFWKALPVASPQSLVRFSISRDNLDPETDLPAAFVRQLGDAEIFAGVAISSADGLSFSYDGRAERVLGEVVSPNFFDLLGVRPILGQGFTAEVRSGHWAPEAVLSYHFWKRRFGGDPGVIGRTIRLNNYAFTIVGVSPPSFFGLVRGTDYELRIPILPEGLENAQISQLSGSPQRWLNVVARLKPGTGLPQAEAAADAQFQQFLQATPIRRFQSGGLRHLQVSPGARGDYEYVRAFRTPLVVVLVLVAIVLLIACSNVANMLLARAMARARELAVRTSIGAGRWRLMRQMLTESILLAVMAGALGLAVAYWTADVLFHFLPQGHISIVIDLQPDGRALLFTFAISLVTGLLFGLAPAIQATRGNLAGTLKVDSAASLGAGRGTGFRRILVVWQVAFSMVLLVAAGIFLRTLSDLRPTEYRGRPDRVLLFTMKPQQEIYSDERRRLLAVELIGRVSALPGVESAALAENGPLGSRSSSDSLQIAGRGPIRISSDSVTAGFFETVGIPQVAGRDFVPGDRAGSPLVVIVNQAFARAFFPNQNPIGKTLRRTSDKLDGSYEIVGVVADTHYYDIHKSPQPFVWFSILQLAPYLPTLHVRTYRSDTAAMIAAIRHEFDVLDKGFPVFNIRTLAVRIEDSLASERIVADLAGAFGMLALALAAVGLYGILAYSVSRRTREIGIRMALGAGSGSVLWAIAREAFWLVGAGSALGLALAVASSRVLSQYFVAVSSPDAAIVAACTFVMFFIGAGAVCVPAMRGCRIDPLTALRHE